MVDVNGTEQPEDGVMALLSAYAMTTGSLVMSDAFETTFGYVMGYEEGLAAQSGIATGALLSVPTKGQQAFAHVDCGLKGSEMACVEDPTPTSDSNYVNDEYDWAEYYFWKFMTDFNASGTYAAKGAIAGYAKACSLATCSPSALTKISPSQMSVVFTGLLVTGTQSDPGNYTVIYPQCWINNTNPNNEPTLVLYNSSTTTLPPPPILGTGVVLGWQTNTASGSNCVPGSQTSYDLKDSGLENGGQFLEVETDAAAETDCDSQLNAALTGLTSGAGNTANANCYYPPPS
jgi:hypothetical protein